MENAFVKATLQEWFNKNQASLAEHINSVDFDAPTGRAASVQLDMPSHTVGISAWDQGNRLEIIMIDVATDNATVEDKSYSNSDMLLARLDAFIDQISRMRE